MLVKHLLQLLKTLPGERFRTQKGQSIVIVTFAFLGLIAMLGLALDLGLVYIEQVRVSRTADAAALASVVELPFEEEAIRRAVEYIELNGYTQQDTEIRVRGCIDEGSLRGGASDLRNVDGGGYPGMVLTPTGTVPITPTTMITGYVYQPALENPPRNVFVIDTLSFQPIDLNDTGQVTTKNEQTCDNGAGATPGLYGTANKLRVRGQAQVDMNFMQFFGFGKVPVENEALGENVTSLDVMVVFDVSGSMNFETTCFGCWEKDSTKDPVDWPFPSNGDFDALNYNPGFGTYPGSSDIFWDVISPTGVITAGHSICWANPQPVEYSGDKYLIHEAEFYSRDVPIHGWEFEKREAGNGFWVLQRTGRGSNDAYIRAHTYSTYSQSNTNNYPQLQGAAYDSQCFESGALSGECWKSRAASLGETAPSNVPWVEYDFTPDWSGQAHIWIRAVGGYNWSYQWSGAAPSNLYDWRYSIYWQVDDGEVYGGPFNGLQTGQQEHPGGNNKWRWLKLGNASVTADTLHTLKLYQGSSGFNVDKIIITNNSAESDGTTVDKNGKDKDGSSVDADLAYVLTTKSGAGPDATLGSATREACNACNPMFGQTVDVSQCSCRTGPADDDTTGVYQAGGTGVGCTVVTTRTNNLSNDLFHDEDPLRSAKEAVKNFVLRLDPKFDQVGFVPFSTEVKAPREKLQCLRYAASTHGSQDYCYNQAPSGHTRPISFTRVISAVESFDNSGSTNIAGGMKAALEELGVKVPGYINVNSDCGSYTGTYGPSGDGEACDRRGGARRVIILMTDGSPNKSVGCGTFNWTDNFGEGESSYNCAMYYSKQAAENNVVVYTVGIGSGVNRDLLTAMATGTDPTSGNVYFSSRGGKYYPAARPSDLDGIFQDILSNIFVRIIG